MAGKGNWKRIGTIWDSDKFKGQYFAVDKECTLLYYDTESDSYFKIKQIGVWNPHKDAPKAAVVNLDVDLNNKYHVEKAED